MSQGMGNPLSKFLGHDPGHKGAHHWRAQRLSALALIPLTVWFLAAMLTLPDYNHETVRTWLSAPWRAVCMSLLVFCLAWHAHLGVQVVIEDYVYGKVAKPVSLLLSSVAHVLLGGVAVFAVLSIAFKG